MDDVISRKVAIDALNNNRFPGAPYVDTGITIAIEVIRKLPSAQPDHIADTSKMVDDCVSRQAAIDDMHKQLWYRMQPNIQPRLDDWILTLPSAQPEIIRCGECKYAEVADKEDAQDGYTCQFHRGSIWFSGSSCSWAERRTDD